MCGGTSRDWSGRNPRMWPMSCRKRCWPQRARPGNSIQTRERSGVGSPGSLTGRPPLPDNALVATHVVALAEAGAVLFRSLSETDDATDAIWERRELADLVRWLLAEMSPEYAGLLTGKYLDEQSLEELSQQWGSSIEATKSKLARARREFRDSSNVSPDPR